MSQSLVHALAIFVMCILILRTVFVEPFGVPTGSMAPALYGNHREAPCPRCGFPVCVGSTTVEEQRRQDMPSPQSDSTCVNCGESKINLHQLSTEIAGDRLLVDKTAFEFRGPRRWEVAVFHCPVDDAKPYVKRVVGLPGEQIRVFDGDVYANGVLQRKNMDEIRDSRILIFSMAHVPKSGWGPRWLVQPIPPEDQLPARAAEPLPGVDAVVQDSRLVLDAMSSPRALGLTYQHWNFETRRNEIIRDTLGYNGSLRRGTPQAAHDFTLQCEIEVLGGAGTFACRLGDGLNTVYAELPVGEATPASAPVRVSIDGPARASVTTNEILLRPGKRYLLEFALVDRRALLSIDGKTVLPALDLPEIAVERAERAVAGQGELTRPGTEQPLQLGVRGVSVIVHDLRLYRDIHYRAESAQGTNKTYQLKPNEYFVLGDNSANSSDSRDWTIPGVPRGAFIGKPFLIHQPLKAGGLTSRSQTVDWERIRLLN